jgi:hypothetical protein
MNKKPIEEAKNPRLARALPALIRARTASAPNKSRSRRIRL